MRSVLLAGLCAAAAHAASNSSTSSCNMTSVATVSSGIETETIIKDTYLMHATTTVTILSLGASSLSSTASPTPSNAKRQAPAATQASSAERKKRHAAIPGAFNNAKRNLIAARSIRATPTKTITRTIGASTTTLTQTHTLSRSARATATAPACDASQNYGLFNGTLNRNLYYGYGMPTFASYPDLSIADCCKQCFQNTDGGCVAWTYDGSVNNTEALPGCQMALYDGGCPARWGLDTIKYSNERKNVVGMGACNVEVAWFQG